MMIDGEEVLVGFGDFFVGKGKGGKPAAGGARNAASAKSYPVTPIPKPSQAGRKVVEHHGKVLKKSKNRIHASLASQKKALQALSRPRPRATLRSGKPITGRTVHVGAVAASAMTPKQRLAVEKHNQAVARAKKAGQVLAKHMVDGKKSIQALAKAAVAQKRTMRSLQKPRKPGVHVGELLADPVIGDEVAALIGEYYESVGQEPDPDYPGYLTDGSPDPAYSSADGSGAPSADSGLTSADLADLSKEDVTDNVTLPNPVDMEYIFEDLTDPKWGAILYDGSKGTPPGYVGNSGLFSNRLTADDSPGWGGWDGASIDHTNHQGFVFGMGPPHTSVDEHSNQWIQWHGGAGRKGAWDYFGTIAEALASVGKTDPTSGQLFGPLIGNPKSDFAGMRVDKKGQMGWLPQEAPEWVLFPIKQAKALTAQKEKEAAEQQAKTDAATNAKIKADQDAAQAAQEATTALTETQARGEQATAETAAQQALVEQQKTETAAAALETEQARQAGEILIAQARQAQEYEAAHPGEAYGPPTDDEMAMQDGEPMPGGDMVQDADGEGYPESEEDYEE